MYSETLRLTLSDSGKHYRQMGFRFFPCHGLIILTAKISKGKEQDFTSSYTVV